MSLRLPSLLLLPMLSVFSFNRVVFGGTQATPQCSYMCGFVCRVDYNSTTPKDCSDVYNSISTTDGVYFIKPEGWTGSAFQVYCSMSNGGGWTVFQRHRDASVNFYRDWDSYKQGFGDLEGSFWLGNEKIHALTNQTDYEMRIDFLDRDGVPFHLTYDLFNVGSEEEKYRLDTLSGFDGNTGYDYMDFHRGMYFSTYDEDNDQHSDANCPVSFRGGWWYNRCFDANLNGDYADSTSKGVCILKRSAGGYQYKLRYTDMKIRPVQ